MADQQSNAPLRASGGLPPSGVIHVRTRLTAHFTVLANRLAQRPGSAVTVGVAAYILSLPDGAPIGIKALAAHFTEGEILIAHALNELEADGYLCRKVEPGPGGRIRTRTYAYDVPGALSAVAALVAASPAAPARGREPVRREAPAPAPTPVRAPVPAPSVPAPSAPAPSAPVPAATQHLEAAAVLSALRLRDPRLLLSEHEIARIAPAVAKWLDLGIDARAVTETLVTDLPLRIERRPARLINYRLTNWLPPAATEAPPRTVIPLQNCDSCDHAFRSPHPGRCRDCRDCPDAAAA